MSDDSNNEVVAIIRRNALRPRKHASFFEWDNKVTKECGICAELAKHLIANEAWAIEQIEPGENPPDCVMLSGTKRIAVEITELVDEGSIAAQIEGDWRRELGEEWTPIRLKSEIGRILGRKDIPHGKFDKSLLLIHTDEPELTADHYDRGGGDIKLPKPSNFDAVYLLFGYDPKFQCCPVRRVL